MWGGTALSYVLPSRDSLREGKLLLQFSFFADIINQPATKLLAVALEITYFNASAISASAVVVGAILKVSTSTCSAS